MTSLERYEYYLNNNPAGERIVEVVEISHSAFPETFYLCKEPEGVFVTLEDGTVVKAEGVNMQIQRADSKENLDEKFQFDFNDTEAKIQRYANMIPLDSEEKVKVTYRLYMASDTNDPALKSILEGETLSFKIGSATINAQAPTLVANRTGELYTLERFPMLQAFYD